MLDRHLFVSGADDLLKAHGPRLRALCGNTIRATWGAWDEEHDEWFPDEAVILGVGSDNLEIVFWKLDELALTWNSIDTSTRPAWVANWDEEQALTWRQDALPALAGVVGKTITGVSVVETMFETKVLEDLEHPENIGRVQQAWVLYGLEFNLGQDRLLVFNALDENGVTVIPPNGPEFRRTQVT